MGDRSIFGIFVSQGSIVCVNVLFVVVPDTEAFHSLFATCITLIVRPTARHINGTIIAGIAALSVGIIIELFFEALLEMLMQRVGIARVIHSRLRWLFKTNTMYCYQAGNFGSHSFCAPFLC